MDLNKLDTAASANEGFEMELFNPGTTEGLKIFITVLGRDSMEYRRVASEQNRRRVARMTKGGTFRLSSALSLEEMESDTVDILSACTKKWRDEGEGLEAEVLLDKEKLSCTKANAALIYTRYPWIREQVDNAVSDRANFTKR